MTLVPLFDLGREHETIKSDLVSAFSRVVDASAFILGAEVRNFEQQAAAYLGCPHAVGLSSGSDALFVALRALGVSAGDEVITSPLTFVATAEAILRCGATPVFADVDPDHLGLCPASTARMRTARTRAVVAVHLYGNPGKVLELEDYCRKEGLPLVEDACQAFGASVAGRKAGTIGTVGVFSFFPTKPLGGLGDGGLLVTADSELSERVCRLRSHGINAHGRFDALAGNFRLDALQAALLAAKLGHVDGARAERHKRAVVYAEAFIDLPHARPLPLPPATSEHAWALYTLRTRSHREELLAHLKAAQIEARSYYPELLPEHPLFHDGCRSDTLTHARLAAREVYSIPIFANLLPAQQNHVIETVRSFQSNA